MNPDALLRPLRVLASGAIALCVLALAACGSDNNAAAETAAPAARNVTLTANQKQHVQLVTVASSTFGATVDTTGVVDFDNDHATSVVAAFSGPVARLLVDVGDKVGKGQPLAIVDSSDFAAAIEAYAKAEVVAKNLRRIADVDKDLLAHKGVGERESAQAQADAAGAEADRDAAQQAMVSLGVDPKMVSSMQAGHPIARAQGIIRAPVSGTVAERLVSPGTLLQAGTTPCFTVADVSHVWVMAQLSDSELASVHTGDSVDVFSGDDARPAHGTVMKIAPVVDPDTRAVAARVLVDNADGRLRKQMYVRVRIHSHEQRSGVTVPVAAVLRDDENLPFVYTVQADGSYARTHVTLGQRVEDRYAVGDGLHAGDRVVTDGGLFLQFLQNQ